MLAVAKIPFSVQMIASLGGDVKPLALSPSSLNISWKETQKNPWHGSEREGDVNRVVMVYLTCAVTWSGWVRWRQTWTEAAA